MTSKIFKKLNVRFFRLQTGKEPVRDWLLSLNNEDCKIIGADIKTVEFSWPIGMPICKPIGRGLYEVRSNLRDGKIARVIFCIEDNKMILLHGFIKKSQKTPEQELNLAFKRKREVLNNE
jgi:phage-related protein